MLSSHTDYKVDNNSTLCTALSSEMHHCVVCQKFTDVSEDHTAFVCRVEQKSSKHSSTYIEIFFFHNEKCMVRKKIELL